MKTRILAFPICVAAIAALDGCKGLDLNSPEVRLCREDTLWFESHGTPDGKYVTAAVIRRDDYTRCRKAA